MICSRTCKQSNFSHSHAPLNQLISALSEYNILQEVPHFDGKAEGFAGIEIEGGEGNFIRDAIERQYLNWLPTGLRFDYKKIKKVKVETRTDCSILWTLNMLEPTAVSIYVTWDDAHLRLEGGRSLWGIF